MSPDDVPAGAPGYYFSRAEPPHFARNMGAELTDRGFGTMDYQVALEPADQYSLDWWFRCVDGGSVSAWP